MRKRRTAITVIGETHYLTPADKDAFLDLPIRTAHSTFKNPVLCHVCQGHGGWHLKLHAFGEGKHFNASCSQCWGYGYVEKDSLDDKCSKHEWNEKSIGKCLHLWTCKHCGRQYEVDSSD